MQDAYLARYGNQDIHKLRGLDRPLTLDEKHIFQDCLFEWMQIELTPREQPVITVEDG